MQKKKMFKTLSEYYIKKGKVYDSSLEYGSQTDAPYSIKEIVEGIGLLLDTPDKFKIQTVKWAVEHGWDKISKKYF